MGQCQLRPNLDKESTDAASWEQGLAWGTSCMQGWRETMEDAHIAHFSLAHLVQDPGMAAWHGVAIFGVMDGHGGEQTAQFCERHLPREIAKGPRNNPGMALTVAFHRMDEMLASPKYKDEFYSLSTEPRTFSNYDASPQNTGCTAVICCLDSHTITIANAGDSRAVLCHDGEAVDLSQDHKPTLPKERARIERGGGWVGSEDRVNDFLALSRAIGDLSFKQNGNAPPSEQIVCSTPDVYTYRRRAADEFLIIACDGVWDVISSQRAVDLVRSMLGSRIDLQQRLASEKLKLSEVAEDLIDACVSSEDNCTAVIVVFTMARSA